MKWEFDPARQPVTRELSEKGSSPTVLGVVRSRTANAIGLLPVKELPARLSEKAHTGKEVHHKDTERRTLS